MAACVFLKHTHSILYLSGMHAYDALHTCMQVGVGMCVSSVEYPCRPLFCLCLITPASPVTGELNL